MNTKRLGIDVNGDIRYGEAENQANNAWLLTSDTVNRWIVNFGRDINVAGVVNSTGGFTGPVTAYDLTGVTQDLNALTLNYTEQVILKFIRAVVWVAVITSPINLLASVVTLLLSLNVSVK
ncbi:hypothetical protein IANJMKHF_00020 [Klebsiella phage CPRSA]|nr:hypothetical protein IANJMKHF_00020 [Klebsiella phage CPRSA]